MIQWIEKFKKLSDTRTHTDEKGISIYENRMGDNRYAYDQILCNPKHGWIQFDTSEDAAWFGIWTHAVEHFVVVYAEKDVSIIHIPEKQDWIDRLKKMRQEYGPAPHAATVINPDNGGITRIFTTQPEGMF